MGKGEVISRWGSRVDGEWSNHGKRRTLHTTDDSPPPTNHTPTDNTFDHHPHPLTCCRVSASSNPRPKRTPGRSRRTKTRWLPEWRTITTRSVKKVTMSTRRRTPEGINRTTGRSCWPLPLTWGGSPGTPFSSSIVLRLKRSFMAFFLLRIDSIVLFGYDTGLGGGVIAQPAFIRDMGITETGKALADIKGNIVSILQGGVSRGL